VSSAAALTLSITAAALPTLFYVALIYWVDRYEKEPWWLLAAAFLWGAVPSVVIAYVFNTVLSLPFYLVAGEATGDTLAASFVAPPVEESLKGIALLAIFLWWRHEIDSPLDGIIYGAMVGMGFAMVENALYFIDVYLQDGVEAWEAHIFMRAVIFGLNHALFTSMTGLGIAIARMSLKKSVRYSAPAIGWATAVFLHFLHNVTVSTGNLICLVALISDWGGVGITVAIIIGALLQERRWLKKYLAEEVGIGTLTLSQYQIASSSRRRSQRTLGLLLSQGPAAYRNAVRFYYRCSELAYKKHHFLLFQTAKSQERVTQARNELVQLRQRLGS